MYRSRLNTLPVELKEEIAEYVLQWGMTATNRRLGILDVFKKYNVRVDELGTGTNRMVVKYKGFALKIALDNEGIDDNRQEWVMSDLLYPDVPRAHEISGDIIRTDNKCEIIGGHLLVADYAPAFANWSTMLAYRQQIRKILGKWTGKYVLGDVGITKKNYANWGLLNGKPVCIDCAYVFPADLKLFTCTCGNDDLECSKSDFASYTCPKCNRHYSDAELRSRIPNSRRHELFSNVEGIRMVQEYEKHDVDIKYTDKEKRYIPAPIDLTPSEYAAAVRNIMPIDLEDLNKI